MPERHFRGIRSKAAPWKKRKAVWLSRHKTKPEKQLWARLKDKKLGVNFHAQKLVYGFILDFWCPAAALCIEVDGPCHDDRKAYDAKRDVILAGKGIITMRFTTAEVECNLPAVVALISDKARRRMA